VLFREIIHTDEWKCVDKALWQIWRDHASGAIEAKTMDDKRYHEGACEVVEEILSMPLGTGKEAEWHQSYKEKMIRVKESHYKELLECRMKQMQK